MHKHELSEDYKALLNGVIDGSITPTQREDEPEGYAEALFGEAKEFFYPWDNQAEKCKLTLGGEIDIKQELEGSLCWVRYYIGKYIVESRCSYKGDSFGRASCIKTPAQVALDALRVRLDRGLPA